MGHVECAEPGWGLLLGICGMILAMIFVALWLQWWRHSKWGGRIERLFLTLVGASWLAFLLTWLNGSIPKGF